MEMTSTLEALDRLQLALSDLIASLQNNAEPCTTSQETPAEAPRELGKTEEKLRKNPEAPKTTLEEVRTVLVAKSREGKTAQVKMLLERFNAASLPEVDPADYAALLESGKAL